jgi:endonuclease/exonuclease/phosphatase family metal-dependent hydrolase
MLDVCPDSDLSKKSGKCPGIHSERNHRDANAGKDQSQTEHAQSDVPSSKQLKISTYNIWNFNGHDEGNYKLRLEQLGKLCRLNSADIFGFQEVRYDFNKRGYWGPNQVEHLSNMLPQYQFVFQPAMSYPENTFARVEEGVAIFSWYPIINHSYILLSRDVSDEGDTHQRICLHAEIETPQLQRIHVFNTHLPLSEVARNRNVLEIWAFIQTYPKPWILMGDLNAEPHSKAMRFLAGLETIDGATAKGLQDVWTTLYPEPRPGAPELYGKDEAPDPGLTFSTLENKLVKRIDYLFVALDEMAKIEAVDLIDDGVRWDGVTSDHLGVSVTLKSLKLDYKSAT